MKRQWFAKRAIEDCKSVGFAFTAGLGSGKTHAACDWHIDRCIQNKNAAFSAFTMPSYQKIFDAAIPTFQKLFRDYGWSENVDYWILKSPFPKIKLRLGRGHEIHLISATRPDKMVAVEYSHATASEAGSQTKDALTLIRTRIRAPEAAVRQFLYEGVTMGTANYFAEVFDDANGGWEQWRTRDYINRTRKLRRFRVSTYDNPFVPDDYIPNLLDTFAGNKAYERAWIFGHFCDLVEGSAYQNYNPAAHDLEDIDPDPHIDVHLTWDFNANPLSWISIQERRFNQFEDYGQPTKWVCVHNAEMGNSQLDEAVVEFAAKHPVHLFGQTPIHLHGDSSGHAKSHKTSKTDYQNVKDYLKAIGYERVTVEALRSNPLETTSVEAVNYWFQIHKLLVCKRCTKLKRSLLSTRWKPNTRKLDKPASDDWTHWGDALKYFAFSKQKSTGNKIRSVNPL